ncbi:unnamed protein product, partial [Mesorhabditis spiculigera]
MDSDEAENSQNYYRVHDYSLHALPPSSTFHPGNSNKSFKTSNTILQCANTSDVSRSPTSMQANLKSKIPYDTFGETAIERIYSEFRFLDDCNSPSSSGQAILKPRAGTPEDRPRCGSLMKRFAIGTGPVVQIVMALGYLFFATLRYADLFQERAISNLLLDLNKPEDFAATTDEGATIIKLRAGTSLVVPSFLQIGSALLGFWPLASRQRQGMMIGHIALSSLAILFWFDALNSGALELNIRYVQLGQTIGRDESIVYLIVAILLYFQVLYMPTITMGFTMISLFTKWRFRRSSGPSFGVVVTGLVIAILAAAAVSTAVYAASRSLTNIDEWPANTAGNPGALYAFGLLEAIVGAYIVSASWSSLLCITIHSKRLFPMAILLNATCLLVLLVHILTPSRLLSVPHAIRVLIGIPKSYPVSHACILILYGTEVALAIMMMVQFILSFAQIETETGGGSRSTDDATDCSQL